MATGATGARRGGRPGELAITVRGLRKRYGELTVLDGLDLEVEGGQLVALLGPNGAGKTTTVEILEGYRRPEAGEVRVLGLDPRRDGGALRPRVGVMLQQGGITPAARPRELVRLHARLFAEPADPDALLELLGLADAATRRYKLLSGGERQRLALALALVGRPELLVLDEPTAGMDPAAKATVRTLIADLRAAGRTILLTTHELADVERLADHVVVIDRGRVLAAGTPAELVAGAARVLRFRVATPDGGDAALDAATSRALGALLGGLIEVDGAAGRHRLVGREPDPATIAALASWCAARGPPARRAANHGRDAGGAFPGADRGAGRRRGGGRDGRRRAAGRPRSGARRRRRPRRDMSARATDDILRPGDGRPSSVLARVAAMLEMELRLTARRLENLFVTLLLPAVLLVFFGSVSILPDAETALPGAQPVDGVLPAILATAIVAAGLVNLGISTGFERSYGVLKRLGASPLTRGQLLAGKIGTIVVVEAVQAVLLVGLAIAALRVGSRTGLEPGGRRDGGHPGHGRVQRDGPLLRRHPSRRGDDGPHERAVPARPSPRRAAGPGPPAAGPPRRAGVAPPDGGSRRRPAHRPGGEHGRPRRPARAPCRVGRRDGAPGGAHVPLGIARARQAPRPGSSPATASSRAALGQRLFAGRDIGRRLGQRLFAGGACDDSRLHWPGSRPGDPFGRRRSVRWRRGIPPDEEEGDDPTDDDQGQR